MPNATSKSNTSAPGRLSPTRTQISTLTRNLAPVLTAALVDHRFDVPEFHTCVTVMLKTAIGLVFCRTKPKHSNSNFWQKWLLFIFGISSWYCINMPSLTAICSVITPGRMRQNTVTRKIFPENQAKKQYLPKSSVLVDRYLHKNQAKTQYCVLP